MEEIENMLDTIADSCKTKEEYVTILENIKETIKDKIVAADDVEW